MVMKLRIPSPRWFDPDYPEKEAACAKFPISREYDPWFGLGDSLEDAMDVCNGTVSGVVCPIREECLRFALKNNCADGIWGGMYEHDRTNLRRHVKEKDWAWHEPTPFPDDLPSSEEQPSLAVS